MATFTVTATQGGSTTDSIALFVAVVTGAGASQPGAVAAATNTTPSDSITPQASGSWVYGSVLGIAGTYTVVSGTTTKQDAHSVGGLDLISCRTTSTTTASTPVTVGYTATSNGISIALCEILNSAGLAEDGSTPAGVSTALATTISTASFTPPAGALLVAMVQSNGGAGSVTISITDTSGLGLSWVEQEKQNGAGNGYSGVWTAAIPSGPPPPPPTVLYSMRMMP
jgi:hypothetical protein